ncbi:MAG TPA: flagellar basal body P-ring formation chaperone FlgA [Steroidobacteraceae bacterium]|jgi:flagella basal body P-ring formation protein FlgA|nr:flagellar basal body P-ring formation chaperone FlgA [Steroidobacteraceae bacterium]
MILLRQSLACSIALLSVCLLSSVTQAQQAINETIAYQSLPELQSLAEQFVRDTVAVKVGELRTKAEPLDSRLHLAACIGKPEIFLPSGANINARTTVGARCNVPGKQWTLYIGVTIETETPVLVLNHAVGRDAQLSATDVVLDVRRVPGLSSAYLTDVKQLTGYSTRQNISAGMVLTPAMLQPSILIRRGQQVTVTASTGGITVRAEAIALADGTANSRIRVRNLSTAKELEGVVDSASMVHVEL